MGDRAARDDGVALREAATATSVKADAAAESSSASPAEYHPFDADVSRLALKTRRPPRNSQPRPGGGGVVKFPDDAAFDAELRHLLAEHQHASDVDVRVHVQHCECCLAIAVLIGNLRRDLWSLAERRPS